MNRTNIYLERRQTEALDRLARDADVSRAEIIRRLLDRSLEGDGGGARDDLRDDLDAIDRSFGALTGVESVDRRGGEREVHLSRVWKLG